MSNFPRPTASTIDQCSTPMFCITDDASFSYVNRAAARLLGYDECEQLQAKSFVDVTPRFADQPWSELWSRLTVDVSTRFETQLLRSDGETIHVEIAADVMQQDGRIHLFAVATETTERALALEALSRSESIQRSIMKSSPDIVFLLDHEARMLFINRTAPGYEVDEVINTSIWDYVGEEFHPAMKACFKRVFETGEQDGYEVDTTLPNGPVMSWEARVAPFWVNGEIKGLAVIARDVTAHRKMLRELQTSERSLAKAQQIARTGSWEFDIVNGRHSGTTELYRILGAPDSESLPTMLSFLSEVVHRDDRQKVVDGLQTAVTQGTVGALEFRIQRQSDGEVRHVLAEAELVLDEHGTPCQLIGTLQDVTTQKDAQRALKEMEAQLTHVARLSTMGEMLAGIAHEVNQPLSAIANFALACSNSVESSGHEFDVPIDEWLDQINQQAVRCGDIIRRMRGFAKKDQNELQWIDLNQVVRDSVALVGSDAGRHLQVFQCDLAKEPAMVWANRIELQQVIVNLLRNACDATRDRESPQVKIDVRQLADKIRLGVQDNGRGVPAHHAPRLFDAFYTTKPEGLGMGLAISKSIVESHHGQLTLESASEEHGARFVVQLPVSHSANRAQNAG